MDYPEWLIGSWVVDNDKKTIWTFNADGSSITNLSPLFNGSYGVIEKVLAITGSNGSYTYDMIVSRDYQVLLLKMWSGGSKVLRKM